MGPTTILLKNSCRDFLKPFPIISTNIGKKRVPVNPHLQPKSETWRPQGFDMFFTKRREWKHEQEYGTVFPLSELISIDNKGGSGKNYFLDLSPGSIKEIIFGCRVNEELEKKICFEIRRRKRTFGQIQLFRCGRHKSRFELKIMPTVCQYIE